MIAFFLAALVLPAAGQTGSDQQPGSIVGALMDKAGNSYGFVTALGADGSGNWQGPLSSLIRYANVMEQTPAGHGHKHGKVIRLKANSGHDKCQQTLVGSNGANDLDGSLSSCDERIYGYDGDDVLVGGAGNNKLDGGKGADVITGGSGVDTFVYDRAGDSPIDGPDIITDFKSRDTLDFRGLARTANVSLSFIGWHPFSGIAGQVNYELSEYWECDQNWHCGDVFLTVVQVDLTGSGTADFCIDLYGRHFLKAKNFIFGSGQQPLEGP